MMEHLFLNRNYIKRVCVVISLWFIKTITTSLFTLTD